MVCSEQSLRAGQTKARTPTVWIMKIDVLTLFPAMFAGPLDESIIQRARKAGLLDLKIHNLRDYAHDRHKTVDDRPFGGGPGMLLKPEPIFEAVDDLAGQNTRVILLSPSGRTFGQAIARELAQCEHLADDELSIGDYVLTNGALPAMVIIDTVVRLIPGVLGHDESPNDESFSHGLLEYPQYTRQPNFARCRCRKCCCLAITLKLRNGAGNRRSCARKNGGQIC